MKSKIASTHKIALLGSIILSSLNASATTVIVAENFGGLSSANLNGTTADTFDAAITSAGGSSTWASRGTDFFADGSVAGIDTGADRGGSAYLNLGTYINAAKGTSTGLFVVSATITTTAGSWLALGFASETTPNVNRNFTNPASEGGTSTTGYGNILLRTNGDIDQFAGSANTNQVATDDVLFTGARTLSVTMDFTPAGGYNGTSNFGTVRFADSGAGTFGSHTYTTNAPIGSALLSWGGIEPEWERYWHLCRT